MDAGDHVNANEQAFERTVARLAEKAGRPTQPPSYERLTELAKRLYDSRRKRARYFQNALLGEPGWDMMLSLFSLPVARWGKLTLTGLWAAAGVPPTTGLRWAKMLELKDLVERHADPLDGRKIFIRLTARGEQLMCDYLSSVYHDVTGGLREKAP